MANPEYYFEATEPNVSVKTDEGFIHECGSLVIGTVVYLSNRTSAFQGFPAGDGSVTRVHVPYCPNCETEPMSHGIITDDGAIQHPSFETRQPKS